MLLKGDSPKLIDEWQIAPKLWDAIRFDIDHSDHLGKFILTGSAVPADRTKMQHTGTGRFAWLTMRPMSLFESSESTGSVSLQKLFSSNIDLGESCSHTLESIAFLACRGGWPQSIDMKEKPALRQAFDYVDAITNNDISRVDKIQRDPAIARRLMKSLARLQGTQSAVKVILADMSPHQTKEFHENTIHAYIGALKKIFVVEDMEAWCPNLRCKTPIRTSDTRYFSDPSIATAALGLGPEELMDDLPTFGIIFETLVIRDLRTYAAALDGNVYHYKDKSGLECDAVIHLRNGKYGLVEIKLGGERLIEEGVKTLNKLASEIDTKRMRQPSFKMIIVATGDFAYQRPDGVIVCPIGALRP
jgi:predicted AAA+ superfamily ATPase